MITGLSRSCDIAQLVLSNLSYLQTPFQIYCKLRPFADCNAFGNHNLQARNHLVISVLSSTPLPGFIGRDFITTTGSSATCQGITASLSFLLELVTSLLFGP